MNSYLKEARDILELVSKGTYNALQKAKASQRFDRAVAKGFVALFTNKDGKVRDVKTANPTFDFFDNQADAERRAGSLAKMNPGKTVVVKNLDTDEIVHTVKA